MYSLNKYLLDMESTYKLPFQEAISGGGAAGVMYACNKVNGIPSVANKQLHALLESFGFNGYRTTDGDGINAMNTVGRQNYTR
jgi:beta-glucosidase-like glycosyl hydrolase